MPRRRAAGGGRRVHSTRFEVFAQAVCAMHAAGVVHGDLKPGNVRLDSKGHVCILDVESAILDWQDVPASTRSRIAHTEAYAAPEVLAEKDCTPASDVYSLGVMLRDDVRAVRGAPPPTRRKHTHTPVQLHTALPRLPGGVCCGSRTSCCECRAS